MGGKLEQLLVSGRHECKACFPRLVSLVCRQTVHQTGGGGDWRSGTAAVSLKLHISPPRRTWHSEQSAEGSLFCRQSTYSACRLACSLRERLWNSEGEGGGAQRQAALDTASVRNLRRLTPLSLHPARLA